MNFKPNLWKSIVSVASGVLVNYLIAGTVTLECNPAWTCPPPSWLEHAFDPVPIVISIGIIGIVYLIWSFIQKKK